MNTILIITITALAIIILACLWYYFKIFKPVRKEQDEKIFWSNPFEQAHFNKK